MYLKNTAKYILYLTITIFIFLLLFLSTITNIYPKDSTSSLYLLSALAQSQAAIFAIAISLNLLGVQIISTIYSSRVVSIFAADFKYLWALYGISIFYDIILMNTLPNNLDESHNILIISSIIVAMLAFVAIIPLINNTINLLNPQNIIKKLSENNELSADEQLFHFIVGSIKQNDFNSYKDGLSELHRITEKQEVTDEKIKSILTILSRIGRFAISLRNEEATIEITKFIGKVGSSSSGKKNILLQSIQEIENIAKYSAINKLEYSTIKSIETLLSVVNSNQINIFKDSFILQVIQKAVADIGLKSSEMHLEDSTLESIQAIHDMVRKTIECDQKISTNIPNFLGRLGLNSAVNKWEIITEKILVTLGEIAINSSTQKNIINLAIDKIGQISLICAENGFEKPILTSLESYEILANILNEDMNDIVYLIKRWIEIIKEHSKINGFENVNISNYADNIIQNLNAHSN